MKIKKSINSPENLMSELLEGFVETYKGLVILGENRTIINSKLAEADGIAIATQGGSGHKPTISGFVGGGMVDISAVGDVLVAPGPQACLGVIKPIDEGKGVLYIALNHTDGMFIGSLTMKRYAKEGLNVAKVVIQEDIVNAPYPNTDDRKGPVGYILAYKIAGTAAAEGESLGEVVAIAQRLVDNMATLAIAAPGVTHPATGSLLVDPDEDEMEIGMGQYEEGGGECQTMRSADRTAKIMPDDLLADLGIRGGEKIMLIPNGTGTIILIELLIIYHRCVSYLKEKNTEIVANYVNEFLTVQEQTGFQMLMTRTDGELLHYWNALCSILYMKK